MPDVIPCPFCPRKLQVPAEVLGQQVQCPSCGQTFVAGQSAPSSQPTAAPDTALAELYEHVSESQPAAIVAPLPSLSIADEARAPISLPEASSLEPGSLEDWRKVRQGVGLLYHGLVTGIVTMLSAMCVSCGFSGYGPAVPEAAPIATILIGLAKLAGTTSVALQLVGQFFCLRSPLEQSPRSLTSISLPLLLGVGIITMVWGIPLMGSGTWPNSRTGILVANLGALIVLVQLKFFLPHLRAIALSLRQLELATSIRQLTSLVAAIIVTLIGMWGAVFAFIATIGSINGKIGGLVFWFFVCALLIMSPLAVSWYVYILSKLHQAVATAVRRRERQAR